MSMPQRFPTYDQIQRIANTVHGVYISTCEIADAKLLCNSDKNQFLIETCNL